MCGRFEVQSPVRIRKKKTKSEKATFEKNSTIGAHLGCLFDWLNLVSFGLLLNKNLVNSADDFKLSSLAQSYVDSTIF